MGPNKDLDHTLTLKFTIVTLVWQEGYRVEMNRIRFRPSRKNYPKPSVKIQIRPQIKNPDPTLEKKIGFGTDPKIYS